MCSESQYTVEATLVAGLAPGAVVPSWRVGRCVQIYVCMFSTGVMSSGCV